MRLEIVFLRTVELGYTVKFPNDFPERFCSSVRTVLKTVVSDVILQLPTVLICSLVFLQYGITGGLCIIAGMVQRNLYVSYELLPLRNIIMQNWRSFIVRHLGVLPVR